MHAYLSRFIAHPDFFKRLTLFILGISGGLYLVQSLSSILEPFIAGLIFAYLLNKVVVRFEALMPRGLIAGLLIVCAITVILLLSATIIPYIKAECMDLFSELPMLVDRFLKRTQDIFSHNLSSPQAIQHSMHTQIAQHYGDIVEWFFKASGNLINNGLMIANLVTVVILTPIITFYLLRDWPRLLHHVNHLIQGDFAPRIRDIAHKIDRTLSSYLLGQTIVCLILTCLYTIGLLLIGLDKAWLIGVLSGVLSFIPYLGLITGLVASLSIAFAHFTSWGQIAGVIAVYSIITLLEGNVITPRLVGHRLGLHPVWIIFSILAGGTWFGFAGILLAIPTAAICVVLIREMRS